MQQILELQTPDFSGILAQFSSLSDFSLELPNLGDLSVQIPGLDMLTGVVGGFTDIVSNLPSSPDDLVSDLLSELEGLTHGSVEIGDLLGQLTTPFTSLGSGLQGFQPMLDQITTGLTQLSPAQVDSTYLSQLLPVSTIVASLPKQSFTSLVQARLAVVTQIQAQVNNLSPDLASRAYQEAMAALTTVTLDDTLTADHLSQLDAKLATAETAIAALGTRADRTLTTVQSWANDLDSFAAELTTTLDDTLTALEPSRLGAIAQPLGQTLELVPLTDSFTTAIDQMESALKAVHGLVDRGIDTVTAGIDTGVGAVEKAIATVEQAIVKVSALVTNAIEQVVSFIQGVDLTGLINQAKLIFNDLMAKLNGVFDTVNGMIGSVFTQVKGLIGKVDELDMQPIVDALHGAIAQITAFLEHPQVANVIQQAKAGIDAVVQKLDPVTLEPVFDQVLTEVDKVKATLEAIDVSQLNAMLKAALSAALDLVRSAIDPPSTVTDAVKEQYNTLVTEQIRKQLVEPIRSGIDQAVKTVYSFEPGTLVGNLLAPPFELAMAKIEELVDPDQLIKLLQPVTELQGRLLKQVNQVINPTVIFAPLIDLYGKLMDFVRSLSAEQILTPINGLIGQATSLLDQLGLESLVAQVVQSVRQVTDWISGLRLEDQAFWQPIQTVLNQGIQPVLERLVNQVKSAIQQLNLSGLEAVVGKLRDVATPLLNQIRTSPLLSQVETMVGTFEKTAQTYGATLAAQASAWQGLVKTWTDFAPLPALKTDYDRLLQRLHALNPVKALALATSRVDQLGDLATTALATVKTLWTQLGDRLDRGAGFLDDLVAPGAEGLKSYLLKAVDALVAGPMQAIAQWAKPLERMKTLLPAILDLQKVLTVANQIPPAIERLGQAVIGIKIKIQGFNLSFLAEPLNRVLAEVVKPLEAINPEPVLVVPLTELFNRVLRLLDRLSPVNLLAGARGSVNFKLGTPPERPMTIPAGTPVVATTPVGEIWFETAIAATLSAEVLTLDVPMQALIAGAGGDVVTDEGVTWSIEAEGLGAIAVTRPPAARLVDRILSLTTLVKKVLLAKLERLHPVKLIAEPLNQQFQKIVALIQDLGLTTLFDALFEKLDRLDGEIKAGLGRLGIAFGGLVAAIPL